MVNGHRRVENLQGLQRKNSSLEITWMVSNSNVWEKISSICLVEIIGTSLKLSQIVEIMVRQTKENKSTKNNRASGEKIGEGSLRMLATFLEMFISSRLSTSWYIY